MSKITTRERSITRLVLRVQRQLRATRRKMDQAQEALTSLVWLVSPPQTSIAGAYLADQRMKNLRARQMLDMVQFRKPMVIDLMALRKQQVAKGVKIPPINITLKRKPAAKATTTRGPKTSLKKRLARGAVSRS